MQDQDSEPRQEVRVSLAYMHSSRPSRLGKPEFCYAGPMVHTTRVLCKDTETVSKEVASQGHVVEMGEFLNERSESKAALKPTTNIIEGRRLQASSRLGPRFHDKSEKRRGASCD